MSAIPRQYNAAVDLVERNLKAGRGSKVAYIDDTGSHTYAELAERVNRAANALVSLGVVGAGLAILLTGWHWIDPVVSLLVNAIIIWGTWGLLRASLGMSMAAVPAHIDPLQVRALLAARPGVAAVHDLHIWPMSTTEIAMTCHLVMPLGHPGDVFLHDLAAELKKRFGINHPTAQIEVDPTIACALAPDEVV